MPVHKCALVAGALGVTGLALAGHLHRKPEWGVTGLARRADAHPEGVPMLGVDLLDRAATIAALAGAGQMTQLFFAAYAPQPNTAEEVAPNLAMLVNLVEAAELASDRLERVVLVQGGKVYGVHLGRYRTPARESDPRHMPPNFYYDQEDYLRGRVAGGSRWSWSALRPSGICGFALGNPMNLLSSIAVFAAVSKALGLPLRFPGTEDAYRALMEVTDADLLARAMEWAATEPRAAGEAFNITNGDLIRWENLWPAFAHAFGMDWAPPQTLRLTEVMADKGPLWDRLVRDHGLKPIPFDKIVGSWAFADGTFRLGYDVISDTGKARRHGFQEAEDSEAMFLRLFDRFRQERIIP